MEKEEAMDSIRQIRFRAVVVMASVGLNCLEKASRGWGVEKPAAAEPKWHRFL
jgi:hypothetical protein